MEKQYLKTLEDATKRDIIRIIFECYNVPKSLKQSYWRAYNAAHEKEKRQIPPVKG